MATMRLELLRVPPRAILVAVALMAAPLILPLMVLAASAAAPNPVTLPDSTTERAPVELFRNFIAATSDTFDVMIGRRMLVMSLLAHGASVDEVRASADTLLNLLGTRRKRLRSMFLIGAAQGLAHREDGLNLASEYVNMASLPETPEYAWHRSVAKEVRARLFLASGHPDSAIAVFEDLGVPTGRTTELLRLLGRAYEQVGADERAEAMYVRSVTVYGMNDSIAMQPLRDLHRRRRGSLAGLDSALAVSRKAGRLEALFASRRVDKPAPSWSLHDLSGKEVRLSDFKDKIVVIDFWGTWCYPCLQAFPKLEALRKKYEPKGVVFLTVNVEHESSAEAHQRKVKAFMASNRYTFPVLLDLDGAVTRAHSIVAFPTTLVIDRAGMVRFANPSFTPESEESLVAQLATLLD